MGPVNCGCAGSGYAEESESSRSMRAQEYAGRDAGFRIGGVQSTRRIANAASHSSRGASSAMNARPLKTAHELADIIVECASALHGPWPAGMTMFIFDDAYGGSASISRPLSDMDDFYRSRTLDLIAMLRSRYDLDPPRIG